MLSIRHLLQGAVEKELVHKCKSIVSKKITHNVLCENLSILLMLDYRFGVIP
ncbi:MAG: hypothetical protein ACOCV8_06105 [Spirochaetota bacterium]